MDRSLTRTYLRGPDPKLLHLGCGGNRLTGWLNSDLYPNSRSVLHLDATRQFPLPADQFDAVFSEHMIEHIPRAAGARMLAECQRVLKPGGRIRISTPDLAFLIDLYRPDKSDLQRRYIAWATERFIPDAPAGDVYVINNFVRDWGHQFIYDEPTLAAAMQAAGFEEISRCELNRSQHQSLANLENESRLPVGFLRLETLILEGVKPNR
ncbi:MAG: methyltransferase domain-containing protein [Pirellulaceae bacterium]|nr:methyltransferase domain-containing protein [Pirellulaceae bacterium]